MVTSSITKTTRSAASEVRCSRSRTPAASPKLRPVDASRLAAITIRSISCGTSSSSRGHDIGRPPGCRFVGVGLWDELVPQVHSAIQRDRLVVEDEVGSRAHLAGRVEQQHAHVGIDGLAVVTAAIEVHRQPAQLDAEVAECCIGPLAELPRRLDQVRHRADDHMAQSTSEANRLDSAHSRPGVVERVSVGADPAVARASSTPPPRRTSEHRRDGPRASSRQSAVRRVGRPPATPRQRRPAR